MYLVTRSRSRALCQPPGSAEAERQREGEAYGTLAVEKSAGGSCAAGCDAIAVSERRDNFRFDFAILAATRPPVAAVGADSRFEQNGRRPANDFIRELAAVDGNLFHVVNLLISDSSVSATLSCIYRRSSRTRKGCSLRGPLKWQG